MGRVSIRRRLLLPTVALLIAAPLAFSQAIGGSDVGAARRRQDLLRLPIAQPAGTRTLSDGALIVTFDARISEERRDEIAASLQSAATLLFDRDGWSRPFSPHSPLNVVVVHGSGGTPAVAGWSGRQNGLLLKPVIAVDGARAQPDRAVPDLVQKLAMLSVRQSAPEEASWAVEGLARFLEHAVLGTPSDVADPFLEEVGSLTWPQATAGFLGTVAPRLPHGVQDIRATWEDLAGRPGDGAESFLREIARQADPRGLTGLLGDLITNRVAIATFPTASQTPARRLSSPDLLTQAPGPLGWRRVSWRLADEKGGLEISLPDNMGVAAGRAIVLYRMLGLSDSSSHDALELVPGVPRTIPLASVSQLNLLLLDGPEPGELFLRLRRVPDYPVALVSSSAEWRDGAVQLVWRTGSHRDLLAWVVLRLVEAEDGSLTELSREIVPASDASEGGFTYHLADRDAPYERGCRYRVFALTTEGFLSEAFEASIPPGM